MILILSFFCFKNTNNRKVFALLLVIYVLMVIVAILDYGISYTVLEVALIIAAASYVSLSFSDLGPFFSRKPRRKKVEPLPEETIEQLIEIINETVMLLSETKTGAIITFEKNEDLSEYINMGDAVDAPVTSELLRTIFYEGTPLHDGAVIIRDGKIAAASVYYTPTTRPLNGKYGARHRAAIGFSEVHRSITVVVSEETGRISFAVEGELISVSRDSFKRRLIEYLS
jgi:diadenylate cyclase